MTTFIDLTEPLPIEVKTTSLGTILIQPWYVLTQGAFKKIKEVIPFSDKSPRLFMEQFVEVFGKTPFEEAKSRTEAFENGTAIRNATALTDDELEMIAGEYINAEIENLLSYYSNSPKRKEKIDTFQKMTNGETKVERLIRLIKAKIEDQKNSPIAKMIQKSSTSFTDKIQDDLRKANPMSSLANMSATETIKNELDKIEKKYSIPSATEKIIEDLRKANPLGSLDHSMTLNETIKNQVADMERKYTSFSDGVVEDLHKINHSLYSLDNRIETIREIEIPPLPTITNPLKDTNKALSVLHKQLEKLSSLENAGIDQTKSLNHKMDALVRASDEASEKTEISIQQMKTSIRLTTYTIIVSVIFSIISIAISLYSIISSNSDTKIYSSNLQRLIEVSQQNGSELSIHLKGLRETMERIVENGSVQDGNQQKVADDISKALNLLGKIEKQSNQPISKVAQ